MPNYDCLDCKCPRTWHSQVTGHCYGCGKDCPSQAHGESLPFEFAQDFNFLMEGMPYNTVQFESKGATMRVTTGVIVKVMVAKVKNPPSPDKAYVAIYEGPITEPPHFARNGATREEALTKVRGVLESAIAAWPTEEHETVELHLK